MRVLPLDQAGGASPGALEELLEGRRAEAVAAGDGRPRLVSISVEVDSLDPLAVLESIFEPNERHIYAERPSEGTAVAGAETALMFSAAGPGRFRECQEFVDATLASALMVGQADLPFSGPLFFAAFTFEEGVGGAGDAGGCTHAKDDFGSGGRAHAGGLEATGALDADSLGPSQGGFAPATLFVPRWQVATSGGRTVATANIAIDASSPVAALAQRIWRAHVKFRSFDYASTPVQAAGPSSSGRVAVAEVGGEGGYERSVRVALDRIDGGAYSKIVLARAVDVVAEHPFHPLVVVNALRERFTDCHAFSIANGRGRSFIGASPERLVRVDRGVMIADALAGSARRGPGASEDAAVTAALMQSDKDRREHALVLDSIVGSLAALGLKPEHPARPGVRRFANVQHLHTPVRAELPAGVRILDILARLHPTAAVAGTPRGPAMEGIAELEPFARGLYAGALGWIDARGGGEFFVGLRSAVVEGPRARLYAGAGIVAGSSPQNEFAETELKFRAVREALLPARSST